MEGFRYLSKTEVESQLSQLLGAGGFAEGERESFLDWAWLVATASDAFASQNRDACAALLRDETEALERIISVRARHVSGISEELWSKRAFLAYLERQVETPQARVG